MALVGVRKIKKLLAKEFEKIGGLDLVAGSVWNRGRRHLRDGEKRRDGI